MAAGIVGYAAYVPYLRIKKEEYQKAWRGCSADMNEKAVADLDEDTVTMAIEAGRQVLKDM
ncbi:MAG TPA: 3-oxoacyl-ACP synthase, partial [Spirochaetia bacterium]|nr:3-oxoacyl-ACP synthase [Spirochaetia bacterium]